jgi:peptidoglycan/LPS O-acetylase OafA/YrhL
MSAQTAEQPILLRSHHVGALDGVRGLAVAGVVAYHLGLSPVSGGFLGVDLFFVLSGFLITSLLLEEHNETGRINLGDFYRRRARRLFPGLFAMVAVVVIAVAVVIRVTHTALSTIDLSTLRDDAFATLAYTANWHSIFSHQSYFAQYGAPSPLQHTWSLAIEEQYYLIWPLLLMGAGALYFRKERRFSWRHIGVVGAVLLAVLSTALMAYGYRAGWDLTHLYDGTDTRIADLLVGGALGVLSVRGNLARWARQLSIGGSAAILLLGFFWVWGGTINEEPKGFFFAGGFLLCAFLGAVVIAAALFAESGPVAKALSWRPLVALGVISYSLYLWHWPVVVLVTHTLTGLGTLPLDLLRVAATLLLAIGSYHFIEAPFRKRRVAPWILVRNLSATLSVTIAAVLIATLVVPAQSVSPVGVVRKTSDGLGGIGGVVGTGGGWQPVKSQSHKLSVALLGDSVMRASAPAIAAALQTGRDVVVHDQAIDGFGLLNDPTWRKNVIPDIAQVGATVVIATWSWDDDCGKGDPTPFTRVLKGPCALENPKRYSARLQRVVTALVVTDHVHVVAFVAFPLTGSPNATGVTSQGAIDAVRQRGEKAWNAVVRNLAVKNPGRVVYFPASGALLQGDRFTSWLPPIGDKAAKRSQWVRVRTVDNVHVCPSGAARYALAIAEDLATVLKWPSPTLNWLGGRWPKNAVYNTPAGACPDDHPPSHS